MPQVLFVLYNLSHKFGFAHYFLSYKRITLHHGTATANFCHQAHIQKQRISRHNLLTEFHIVNLEEVCAIFN